MGEGQAVEYLKKIGYKILERNLKLFCGEIDILANPPAGGRKTIVIVEVKTVRGSGFGLAQDLVRYRKQDKLRMLARAVEQKYPKRSIRIDVIGVDLSDPENPKIEHLKNAIWGS